MESLENQKNIKNKKKLGKSKENKGQEVIWIKG